MITCYVLMFSADGTLVEPYEEFASLDRARDVAFEVSLETGKEVAICRDWGISSNIIEEVRS